MSERGRDESSATQLTERLVAGLRWIPVRRPAPVSAEATETFRSSLAASDLSERVRVSLGIARPSQEGGAFAQLLSDQALESAKPGGRPAGALSDYIVGIKDLLAIKGVPRIAGSATRADSLPELTDAWMTRELRRHGAIVLGSTAMHELAFGTSGINEYCGTPLNPHDARCIPGGSSSGSAVAVAEGSVDLAIGSDTGGSIRIPSALCGIAGFKPTFATYSMDGVLPLSPTFDHLGLHARSMRLIVEAHETLSNTTIVRRNVARLAVVRGDLESCDAVVGRAVRQAMDLLQSHGVELVEVELPAFERVFAASSAILLAEAYAVNRRLVEDRFDLLGHDVAERFAVAAGIPAHAYYAALSERAKLQEELASTLEGFDGIIGPTAPIVAPQIVNARSDASLAPRLVTFARLANVTGCAAVTLPLASDDLPVGLQVMALSNDTALSSALGVEALLTS